MDEKAIILRRVRSNFTTLPNEIIQDPKLSWKALGLLTYILSLPDNWKLRLSHLSQQKKTGRDATRTGLRELEEAGYLYMEKVRGEHGQYQRTVWLVTDTPGVWT